MTARTLVKICGTTSPEDARLAADAGADYLGVILNHPPSPRNVQYQQVRPVLDATSLPVAIVTVNQNLDTLLQLADDFHPAALQLHGDESPDLVRALKARGLTVWTACSGESETVRRRALSMTEAGADAVLVDARAIEQGTIIYGGTGHRSDWNLAHELVDNGLRVILAGGLAPDNIREAIDTVHPWIVDTISGVEAAKGRKDADKVRRFIATARDG
jgi:phosphoribosylanthranilate isomerase